jgi:hypothetical protein
MCAPSRKSAKRKAPGLLRGPFFPYRPVTWSDGVDPVRHCTERLYA